jgi:hypothetical protein
VAEDLPCRAGRLDAGDGRLAAGEVVQPGLSDAGALAVRGSAAEDGRLRPPAGRRLRMVWKILTDPVASAV